MIVITIGNYCLLLDMYELYEVTHVLIIQCDPLNFLLKQLLQTYALFSCQLEFQDLVLNAVDFTRENV